jgi:hypothetical protein
MRTAQEWLALSESEQAVELAEVLVEKPWKHSMSYVKYSGYCPKCRRKFTAKEKMTLKHYPCPVPDPIDIHDWNVAMEWRDKIIVNIKTDDDRDKWDDMLHKVFDAAGGRATGLDKDIWFVDYAQPIHYLIAAAMAKEGLKK